MAARWWLVKAKMGHRGLEEATRGSSVGRAAPWRRWQWHKRHGRTGGGALRKMAQARAWHRRGVMPSRSRRSGRGQGGGTTAPMSREMAVLHSNVAAERKWGKDGGRSGTHRDTLRTARNSPEREIGGSTRSLARACAHRCGAAQARASAGKHGSMRARANGSSVHLGHGHGSSRSAQRVVRAPRAQTRQRATRRRDPALWAQIQYNFCNWCRESVRCAI